MNEPITPAIQFRHPGERRAWSFLKKRGHKLIDTNVKIGRVEIDLITVSEPQRADSPTGETLLHLIEVKEWRRKTLCHPLEQIDRRRLGRLHQAAAYYLARLSRSNWQLYRAVAERYTLDLLYGQSISTGAILAEGGVDETTQWSYYVDIENRLCSP